MNNDLLSAQEVADVLKIARNTVYELIKRGELNSSKVGKQVRVQRREVDAYLIRTNPHEAVAAQKPVIEIPDISRSFSGFTPHSNFTNNTLSALDESKKENELIICGQDISLDILINHLSTVEENMRIFRSYMGSYNSIYSLYQGRVNVATAHLWDGDTNEYNTSYVKKMMPGIPTLMIRIGKRKQGLYVQKNNPKGLHGWSDLKRDDIKIVNREKGSGTRILLDEKLRLMGIIGDYIDGYNDECKSHIAVATTVARGEADIAIGSEFGCRTVSGVDFIPLQTEAYDVIIRLTDAQKPPYRTMLEIISSDVFKLDLESIGGYDVSETGNIIWGA